MFYTIPAPGQKHGFLNEHGAGKQDIPAGPDVIRAEKQREQNQTTICTNNNNIKIENSTNLTPTAPLQL